MKLKEALELYDIIVTEPGRTPPEGGTCVERQYNLGDKRMWKDGIWKTLNIRLGDEETAVAYLVEGATPLSPMERAMRKWPIRKDDDKYILNGRHVVKGHLKSPEEYYYNDKEHDLTHYTESEAVAYLLEGYKPELPAVKVVLEHVDTVDVKEDKKTTSIDQNVHLDFGPTQAQIILDTIWRAGYRPTKEEVK